MGADGFWFKCMAEVIEPPTNSCILNGWSDQASIANDKSRIRLSVAKGFEQ